MHTSIIELVNERVFYDKFLPRLREIVSRAGSVNDLIEQINNARALVFPAGRAVSRNVFVETARESGLQHVGKLVNTVWQCAVDARVPTMTLSDLRHDITTLCNGLVDLVEHYREEAEEKMRASEAVRKYAFAVIVTFDENNGTKPYMYVSNTPFTPGDVISSDRTYGNTYKRLTVHTVKPITHTLLDPHIEYGTVSMFWHERVLLEEDIGECTVAGMWARETVAIDTDLNTRRAQPCLEVQFRARFNGDIGQLKAELEHTLGLTELTRDELMSAVIRNAHPSFGRTDANNAISVHNVQPEDYKQYNESQFASHIPFPKESTVNNIKVETITFVNGTPVDKMTNDEVFHHISTAEAEIERLIALKRKPAALQKRIDELNSNIEALIAAIDARDGVKPSTPTA